MRAPLCLDITPRDLALAGWWLLSAHRKRPALQRIRQRWRSLGGGPQPLVCLSVRSAFDLFLEARCFPVGTEVAISAITHPDMPRLLRAHGLVPVPVDIGPDSLAPSVACLAKALSSKTRAVLLTHLLGGHAPIHEIAQFCAEHGLELWEDCAQRFPSVDTSHSAVSFYSFGPLKTATALAGAIVDVKNPDVRERMLALQRAYPTYPRWRLAVRTGKLGGLAEVARHPRVYAGTTQIAARLGFDARHVLRSASKSFGAHTTLTALRQAPSPATLRLIAERLALSSSNVHSKAETAQNIVKRIGAARVLGHTSPSHHWLLVVYAPNAELTRMRLKLAGFDALCGISNLEVVPVPPERPELSVEHATDTLKHALLVPLHPDYSKAELERLSSCFDAA